MKNSEYSNFKKGFSLLEVLVALAVFGLVMAAAAGAFSSIQQAWRKQRNTIDLVQNARWAMEFMANEIREKNSIFDPEGVPERLFLSPNPLSWPPSSDIVWYWRGDGTVYGNTSAIYRGTGETISIANGNRQELTNFIVDNTLDLMNNSWGSLTADGLPDPIFFHFYGNDPATITLTVRPRPDQPVGRENRDYVLRMRVRARNYRL